MYCLFVFVKGWEQGKLLYKINLYIEIVFFHSTIYFIKECLFYDTLKSKAEDLQQNILLHNSYLLS